MFGGANLSTSWGGGGGGRPEAENERDRETTNDSVQQLKQIANRRKSVALNSVMPLDMSKAQDVAATKVQPIDGDTDQVPLPWNVKKLGTFKKGDEGFFESSVKSDPSAKSAPSSCMTTGARRRKEAAEEAEALEVATRLPAARHVAKENALTIQIRAANDIVFVPCMISIFLMLLENELFYFVGPQATATHVCAICQCVTVLVSLIVLFRFYVMQRELDEHRFRSPPNGGFLSILMSTSFLPDAVMVLLHVPPFLFQYVAAGTICFDCEFDPFVDANYLYTVFWFHDVLNLAVLLRLIIVARFLRYHSEYYTPCGRFTCATSQVKLTFSFIFRSLLEQVPFTVISAVLATSTLLSGYCAHVSERRFEQMFVPLALEHEFLNHQSIMNDFWLVVIAMSTVGFGDVLPRTFIGRTSTLLGGVMGIFCTALMIAVIHRKLQLTWTEKKVVTFLRKDERRKLLRNGAAAVMQATWLQHKSYKLAQESGRWVLFQFDYQRFFRNLRAWREIQWQFREESMEITPDISQIQTTLDNINSTLAPLVEAVCAIDANYEAYSHRPFTPGTGASSSRRKRVSKSIAREQAALDMEATRTLGPGIAALKRGSTTSIFGSMSHSPNGSVAIGRAVSPSFTLKRDTASADDMQLLKSMMERTLTAVENVASRVTAIEKKLKV